MAPAALLYGGDPTDPRKPALWISGTGSSLQFENIAFTAVATSVILGQNAAGASSSVSTTSFVNCYFNGHNTPGTGPVILIDYAFWVWFEKCHISWNPNGSDADHQCAILIKPSSGSPGSGLVHISDSRMVGRALRYYVGNIPGLFVKNVVVETIPNNTPAFEIMPGASAPATWAGTCVFNNLTLADEGTNCPALRIDSQFDPSLCLCLGMSGVIGPATIVGNPVPLTGVSNEILSSAGVSIGAICPTPANQIGFGPNGTLTAQHDSTRRAFAPAAARYANLATQDVARWSTLNGTATVTTGITAPDGTTKAAKLSTSTTDERDVVNLAHTFVVGEWFIAGVWVQAATPAKGPYAAPLKIDAYPGGTVIFNNGGQSYVQPIHTVQGNGEWAWCALTAKVTSVRGKANLAIVMRLQCDSTHPTNFYAPIFLNIPANTIGDNEVKEMAVHLQPWSDAATVGEVGTLQSHVFTALGGLKSARFLGLKRTALTYGTTVNLNALLGNEFDITVTNASAFTIANPTNPLDGQRITITVRNMSGRPMGAITWGARYKLAAWTNPATANSRSIDFRYDGVNWVEVGRTPNDVPN